MSPSLRRRRTPGPAILALAVLMPLSGLRMASAEPPPAAEIYRDLCAHCHGENGQGVEGAYSQPLAGEQSVAALTRLIERTMPEGEPDLCVGEDAQRIAEYIYHEFYSYEARLKKGLIDAPRVELSRLTVAQYQNVVADLVGHFTPTPRTGRRGRDDGRRGRDDRTENEPSEPQPGLRAEYYQSEGMNKANELAQQRVDPYIDFDFGKASPAEGITPDQFAIIWEGALIADWTGFYEFRIRSENGFRLYVNSEGTGRRGKLRDDSSAAGTPALVDGWVSSGEMRELNARVFLIGGRQYPLRLEFFKYLQDTASVVLEWKPPHGAWGVLGPNHLSTANPGRIFVVETSFPADDRSAGYERGSAASPAWISAITNAAVETAAEVLDRLPLLADLEEDEASEEKLKDFLVEFVEIAFRRPLSEAEARLFRESLFAESPDPKTAVRRGILLALKSPHFLYTDLTPTGEQPTQHQIAARLAFALWDSLPDEPLRQAARDGELVTTEQIEVQAARMVNHPRTKLKLRTFFEHWLELEERDLAKDKALFPEFDEATRADLRYSLEQFIEQVVWSESSDYQQLLLADYLLLNERLKDIYLPEEAPSTAPEDEPTASADEMSKAPPDTHFEAVTLDADRRAGLLTHPYLLSAYAYHNNTSPIHRGVFLARSIVGRSLRPPPVAVSFKDDEFDPHLTMREKITQLTSDSACMSCHSVINPLGFTLESYDAVGRWRTSDPSGKPIDTTSEYTTVEGETLRLDSARQVAQFAAESEAAQRRFITAVFHHLAKQSPMAYGPETIDRLHARFVEDRYNIQKLLAHIAVITATHPCTTSAVERDES